MEEGTRSGESSGVVVKNRNSSGCLIIREKGDGIGSSRHQPVFNSKKEKKRPRLIGSDSGSSDERLEPYRKRVVSRAYNGYDKGIVESAGGSRKRNSFENIEYRNDVNDSVRMTSRLGVFEFDEYDAIDDSDDEVGGKSFLGSKAMAGSGIRREFEIGSSKGDIVYKRKHFYFDRASGYVNNRLAMKRDTSEEPIRVQGRNGVLKVLPNKKKKGSGLLKTYDRMEGGLRPKDAIKRNELVRPSFNSIQKVHHKAGSSIRTDKNKLNLRKSLAIKNSNAVDWESDNSDTSLKLSRNKSNLHKSSGTKDSKDVDWESDNSDASLKLGKKKLNLQKSSRTKNNKGLDLESDHSDASLKLGPKKLEGHKPLKLARIKGEITPPPSEKITPSGSNEGKIRRGSGTEKQKLREQIRKMLLDAGWTIDYRPRRNRDYQDAVYVNPSGTAYWSIIKAYDALQKQFDEEDDSLKPSGKCSSFSPISDHVLNKLTRQTQKKIEKEMKRKQRDANRAKNAQEPIKRSAKNKHDTVRKGSDRAEEKLSSLLKQRGKSWKGRTNENVFNDSNLESQNEANYTSEDNINGNLSIHGRKSRKLGRCTLVVRSTKKGQNSETDGYISYTGKRTLLSWLIDSGTVGLSEKVQYMNRRKTRVMQEGWITRDGIHCGCCSKILTVTKFEIHAGSKLRQPFQNIYLESGISLLQCQMDAWNRHEESERSSFHSVYVDGDDPNDDTCGICGDGGDLICCDGCPSTFHQTCLGIQMLPMGDWHCPNCTCKLCGMAGSSIAQGNEITVCVLPTCSLCERKYHQSCVQEVDSLPVDSTCPSFCGQKCREIFENLQKFLGVKHELEGGFSWSLIHRTDISDSDTSVKGLAQRVECNSKLAVALTVMEECFLPIMDRRSGINLIRNVLYNCGSNFNRLNYSGFYTAILERGDEIISAASIRLHGTQLAEMPFIGTRHIYRRQGMCNRLFRAIESALCSFKVETLIIPAISELMHTWTEVFGFGYLEESQKEELRSMNILVFPGIDMFQKLLMEDANIHRNVTTSTGAKSMEIEGKSYFVADILNKSGEDSLVGHDLHACEAAGGPDVVGTDDNLSASQGSEVTLNGVSVPSTSLDAPREVEVSLSSDKITCSNSQSGEKVPEYATESKSIFPADASSVVTEREDNSVLDPLVRNIKSSEDMDISNSRNNDASVEPVSHSFDKISVQSATGEADENKDNVCASSLHGTDLNIMQFKSDLELYSPCEKEGKSCDASKDTFNVTRNEIAVDSFGECSRTGVCEVRTDSQLGHNLSESASDSGINVLEVKTRTQSGENDSGLKCVSPFNTNQDASKMENRPPFDTPLGGVIQSSFGVDIDGLSVNESVACVEPALHLSGEISAHNSTEEIHEDEKATSFPTSNGTDDSLTES